MLSGHLPDNLRQLWHFTAHRILKNNSLVPVIILVIATGAFRLQQLGKPLVDYHPWRQCDTASIARNFYRNGIDLFWPQIDWAGPNPGYVGTEFPLYQGIVAVLYNIFGLHEQLGRGVSAFFSIGGVIFLYLFVRRLYDPATAFVAALAFSFMPLYVILSQQFMPDVTMLTLTLGALYFLYSWYRDHRTALLYLSAAFFALALLAKLPTGIHYLPLAYIFYLSYEWRFIRKWQFWLYVVLTALPPLLWYYHAVGISQNYYPYHFFGAVNNPGKGALLSNLAPILTMDFYMKIPLRILTLILNPIGLLFFITGIVSYTKDRKDLLLYVWLISVVAYLFIFAHGNFLHSYYQIILGPLCAIFIAKGILIFRQVGDIESNYPFHYNLTNKIPLKYKKSTIFANLTIFLSCSILIIEIYLIYVGDIHNSSFLKSSTIIQQITTPDTLVVTSDDSNPVTLYLSDRKGWPFPSHSLMNGAINQGWSISAFEDLIRQGGRYFLVIKSQSRFHRVHVPEEFLIYMNKAHEKLVDREDFAIYKLHPEVIATP